MNPHREKGLPSFEQTQITSIMSKACCPGVREVPDNFSEGIGQMNPGHNDNPSLGDNMNQRPVLTQEWICACRPAHEPMTRTQEDCNRRVWSSAWRSPVHCG